jgi:hypothetical protein
MYLKDLLDIQPFSITSADKARLFRVELQKLTLHHYNNCFLYRQILDKSKFDPLQMVDANQAPYLPVELFKNYLFSSVPNSEVSSTLKSSGTSGQLVSKIFLDKITSLNQKKVLAKITRDFIGNVRLPMLILDSSNLMNDRAMFSARGAGIMGFSVCGSGMNYAFDENMDLNFEVIDSFLKRYSGQKVLLFGFTFIVWQHFFQALRKCGRKLALENSILIHGGGWKKLTEQAVDSSTFKLAIQEVSGITKIHNYYGMAEQTGSIFMECEHGHYHCSIFSDIFMRRGDFSTCNFGELGLIQVISLLPHSYPGHVLLTEDQGILLGEDNCPCGRLGKYFLVNGRIEKAELRGCSDTYQG